jgi:DNA modification methylase
MLFKKNDVTSGKTLVTSKPLLTSAASGYVRPKDSGSEWFLTTTTIWPADELIGRRIRDWRRLTGETGHSGERATTFRKDHDSIYTGTFSVFPVPLAEWIILRYGGDPDGTILDAFAGGPPRALAASVMGYKYVGYEIRQEQIDENIAILKGLGLSSSVEYRNASGITLDGDTKLYDMALTCPPYFNLEVYSDKPEDISNCKDYFDFDTEMCECAISHSRVMKPGAFVCIIVGNFRDKNGELIDFRGDTVQNFKDAGFIFWQDIILSKNFASAAVRAGNAWKGRKLVPRHEHLLVFKTPEK